MIFFSIRYIPIESQQMKSITVPIQFYIQVRRTNEFIKKKRMKNRRMIVSIYFLMKWNDKYNSDKLNFFVVVSSAQKELHWNDLMLHVGNLIYLHWYHHANTCKHLDKQKTHICIELNVECMCVYGVVCICVCVCVCV